MESETPALKKHYLEVVVPALMKKFGYENRHQVPFVEKIVINSGIKASEDKGWINEVEKQITALAGQKAVIVKAKKSISNFKLRQGWPNGVKVTLRGPKMYDYLYRLIAVTLPNVRDFRGVPTKFDGQGNYNLGVTDISIHPEVTSEGSKKNIGMDIAICTTAKTDKEGMELLSLLGMPFRKSTKQQTATAA